MENTLTVSVAIATYNRASMVREAVEAALVQIRTPDEIIVADDASSDGTADSIGALPDVRIKVLRRETNSGGVENWNAAMRQTRGDVIAWCSDDDRFVPDHLEASVAFLEAHPEIAMVHSGFIDALETPGAFRWTPRPLRSTRPLIVDGRNLLRYMIRYYNWPFHPSTLVMRREVWERTGPFDASYALADTDWFVRAAQEFTIAMLPRHGVVNRRHPGNWSNRVGSARMQREIFSIVDGTVERGFWKMAWRMNVRARLAWTMRMRIASGHAEAARAAWHAMLQDTGRRTPEWIERWGARAIAWWCAAHPASAGPSLTPL